MSTLRLSPARLRAAYLQAFDDTVTIARRWASTGERHSPRGELNRQAHLARYIILERICAEGQVARLQLHAERFAPESLARQLARARRTIENFRLTDLTYK